MFLILLTSVRNSTDAVGNDVQRYLKCWVNARQSVASSENCDLIQERNAIGSVLSDAKIINIIRDEISTASTIYNIHLAIQFKIK